MALKHANDETFDSMLSDGLTLVDFWATWCGPCQMFGPIFESVSEAEKDVNYYFKNGNPFCFLFHIPLH